MVWARRGDPPLSASVPMFLRIAKILTEEQLATVRASLSSENAPWVDGRVTAGRQSARTTISHNLSYIMRAPIGLDRKFLAY